MLAVQWFMQADELTQTIIHCVMRRHLIVIFSLDDKNTMKDIDIAILHAIMKGESNINIVNFIFLHETTVFYFLIGYFYFELKVSLIKCL